MKRVSRMPKHQHQSMVKSIPTLTVLVTVSARRMAVMPDETADEEKDKTSVPHPQMKRVASTVDTPGVIVTTTPGEFMPTSQDPQTDATTAEADVEASKAEETATAVVEMEIETVVNIILKPRRPRQLQSRDSRQHQHKREPRGTQLSSITLTSSVKAPNTDGNPALGIQVNINCTSNCIAWTTEKNFLFVNYKQKN
jgi:hypothetical protein